MPKLNLGRVKGDKGDSFTFDDFTPDQLDGITPKMLLGNVTTLDPDENATIDMRKDGLKNYVDFGIPRGKNGAEIKNISAENVVMANGTTLESTMTVVNEDVDANTDEINKIKLPTFTDTVSTYTTLNAANTAAETSSNAIKSKVSIFTTLSNIKKSFSAIVQGLKILGTNVGMIQGITSDLNSESDYIAASSKALATLNGNLSIVLEPNFCGQGSGCITCNPSVKTVNITCGMHSDVPFATNTLIYNIDMQYAPKARKSLYGIAQRNNQLFMAQLVIDIDGSIKYYGSLGDGSCDLMFFTGTYYYG